MQSWSKRRVDYQRQFGNAASMMFSSPAESANSDTSFTRIMQLKLCENHVMGSNIADPYPTLYSEKDVLSGLIADDKKWYTKIKHSWLTRCIVSNKLGLLKDLIRAVSPWPTEYSVFVNAVLDSPGVSFLAAEVANKEMLEFLIDRGMHFNHTFNVVWTPMHSAARAGNLDAIKIGTRLAAYGLTFREHSPMLVAIRYGNLPIVEHLKFSHMVRLVPSDMFELAVRSGNPDMFTYLTTVFGKQHIAGSYRTRLYTIALSLPYAKTDMCNAIANSAGLFDIGGIVDGAIGDDDIVDNDDNDFNIINPVDQVDPVDTVDHKNSENSLNSRFSKFSELEDYDSKRSRYEPDLEKPAHSLQDILQKLVEMHDYNPATAFVEAHVKASAETVYAAMKDPETNIEFVMKVIAHCDELDPIVFSECILNLDVEHRAQILTALNHKLFV